MSKYSIVVPAYNEEETLRLFYEATVPAFESLNEEFELIFVNDGSTDKTQEILAELAEQDKRVKVCRFSRNFGQQAALLCGLETATGDAVIAMDADLQDSPKAALEMIEEFKFFSVFRSIVAQAVSIQTKRAFPYDFRSFLVF